MTNPPQLPTGQVLLYQTGDGRTKLDVRLESETVWLNQRQLTELFGKAKGTISEHIKHIFEDAELRPMQLFGYSEQFNLRGSARWFARSSTTISTWSSASGFVFGVRWLSV